MNKPWPKILLLLLLIFCYIHLTWTSNARHSDLNFDEYVVLISRQITIFYFEYLAKKLELIYIQVVESGCGTES